MSLDARTEEELRTQRRAGVLHMEYVDTSKLEHQLFKNVLTVPEQYELKIIPLYADEHNIHFGVLTTTSQQTINKLSARFSDQRVKFSIISETGYSEYMKLFDPPKQIVYQDIGIAGQGDANEKMISEVSATLDQVRPDAPAKRTIDVFIPIGFRQDDGPRGGILPADFQQSRHGV